MNWGAWARNGAVCMASRWWSRPRSQRSCVGTRNGGLEGALVLRLLLLLLLQLLLLLLLLLLMGEIVGERTVVLPPVRLLFHRLLQRVARAEPQVR